MSAGADAPIRGPEAGEIRGIIPAYDRRKRRNGQAGQGKAGKQRRRDKDATAPPEGDGSVEGPPPESPEDPGDEHTIDYRA